MPEHKKILFSLFVVTCALFSGNLKVDEAEVILNTENINGRKFVNSKELLNKLEIINNIDNNKIFMNKGIIKFASGSFYLVFESESDLKVFQMPVPVLRKKGEYYFPAGPLAGAFKYFGLLSSADNEDFGKKRKSKSLSKQLSNNSGDPVNAKRLRAETTGEKDKSGQTNEISGMPQDKDFFVGYFKNLHKKLEFFVNKKSSQKPDTAIKSKERLDLPPDIYLIPEGLKRRDIEKNE